MFTPFLARRIRVPPSETSTTSTSTSVPIGKRRDRSSPRGVPVQTLGISPTRPGPEPDEDAELLDALHAAAELGARPPAAAGPRDSSPSTGGVTEMRCWPRIDATAPASPWSSPRSDPRASLRGRAGTRWPAPAPRRRAPVRRRRRNRSVASDLARVDLRRPRTARRPRPTDPPWPGAMLSETRLLFSSSLRILTLTGVADLDRFATRGSPGCETARRRGPAPSRPHPRSTNAPNSAIPATRPCMIAPSISVARTALASSLRSSSSTARRETTMSSPPRRSWVMRNEVLLADVLFAGPRPAAASIWE